MTAEIRINIRDTRSSSCMMTQHYEASARIYNKWSFDASLLWLYCDRLMWPAVDTCCSFVCGACVSRITRSMCIRWLAIRCTRRRLWNTTVRLRASNIHLTDHCWRLVTRTARCFCISCLTTRYVVALVSLRCHYI